MNMNNIMNIVDETKKLTTLVLEDEPYTNELMSTTLKNFFNKVYSAFDGDGALELYKKHQPDIIFVDIILPGRNGLEIAKEIRDINSRQKIIIVTASNDMGYISEAVEIGVDNFIRKPIDTDKMIGVLIDVVSDIKREKKRLKKKLKKKFKKIKMELKIELEKEIEKEFKNQS